MLHDSILVIDNSCLSRLTVPECMERFRTNIAIADLTPRPSDLNLTEAVAASPPSVQRQLLGLLKDLANGYPLLPWPFELLRLVAQTVQEGHTGFILDEPGHEWLLDDCEAAERETKKALAFMREVESKYSEMAADGRPKIQKWIKENQAREYWEDAKDFLHRFWRGSEVRDHLAQHVWLALGFQGGAPLADLLLNEAWQLFLDAEGFSLYQRAIAFQQSKRVHLPDLLQLPYLAVSRRRVIATADESFLRAAGVLLDGTYPLARAIHIEHLVA